MDQENAKSRHNWTFILSLVVALTGIFSGILIQVLSQHSQIQIKQYGYPLDWCSTNI